MAEHNAFGAEAERRVAQFLAENEYKILKRNWRYLQLEIDIIAEDLLSKEIVMVEVKARTNPMVDPLESITQKKRKNLVTAADYFITSNEIALECRFDIVLVERKQNEWTFEHLKNAFLAFE
ncbi:MAG TPA: YraN family protein [Moheibacter sp.]|nr:YraN family protein [Moheibacter sp.]